MASRAFIPPWSFEPIKKNSKPAALGPDITYVIGTLAALLKKH
jgi:hypothetical protein